MYFAVCKLLWRFILIYLSNEMIGIFTMNQVGTVINLASDFFTGRLTKKERKATLADELLSDHTLGEYR